MPAIVSTAIKVIIVEKQDMLREKIAGILSREENITMVIQVSSYSKLQTVMSDTEPVLVIGDFFEFNKFCKGKGVSSSELCHDANIFLYTDEYEPLNDKEVEQIGDQKVFDIRHIQQEVRRFLKDQENSKQTQLITKKSIKKTTF